MDFPLKTPEQLRQQMRSLRKQRGLTQARLGGLIGVTQARVVEIEANPGAVSLQQVMQVLNALGAGFVLRDEATGSAPATAAGTSSPAPAASPAKKGSW